MSVGNAPITISFQTSGSTLITGKNGSSKSTVIDSLCFALFGVAYRDIKKGQLVNSVNLKQCLVTLNFSVDNVIYKINRGIKPNIFEIWKNDELINQESATRDYQKYLEKFILKFNLNTFRQTVALGSSTFLSFMRLTAAARRDIIEEILDIKIFSSMTKLNKEKSDETKQNLMLVESELSSLESKIKSQEKLILRLTEMKAESIGRLESDIQNATLELKEVVKTIKENEIVAASIQEFLDKSKSVEIIESKRKLTLQIFSSNNQIENLKRDIDNLEKNSNCKLCGQDITHLHDTTAKEKILSEIVVEESQLVEYEKILPQLEKKVVKIESYISDIKKHQLEVSKTKPQKLFLENKITDYNNQIAKLTTNTSNVELEKNIKKQFQLEELELTSSKSALLEMKQIQTNMALLLKDGGIKTSIVKEYLPIMNTVINKYLDSLDFFVKFELDENFNEVIKSRHRDEFSYASFSEGEKQRIDVAILLAWVYIAKLKNSIDTNILFLDEVLSGNLDEIGVDLFMNLVDELKPKLNIILVSHNNQGMIDRFDNVIEIQKIGNFSEIKLD